MKTLLKILGLLYALLSLLGCSTNPVTSKSLDKPETDTVIHQYNEKLINRLVDDIADTSPFLLKHYSREEIENVVRYHYSLSDKYSLHESITMGYFTLATLFYGQPIDKLDREGVILSILTANYLTERQKLYYIQERITFMDKQRMIYNRFRGEE